MPLWKYPPLKASLCLAALCLLLLTGHSFAESTPLSNKAPHEPLPDSSSIEQLHKSANPVIDAYIQAAYQSLHMGNDTIAEHYLLQAIKEARLSVDDPLSLSFALSALGRLYEHTHQLDKALAVYQEALTIQEKNQLPAQFLTKERLVSVYSQQGQLKEVVPLYDDLIRYHRQALTILQPSMDEPEPGEVSEIEHHQIALIRIYQSAANTLFSFGQLNPGLLAANEFIKLAEQVFEEDSVRRFHSYLMMARWYQSVGQTEVATFWAVKAVHLYEAEAEQEHPAQAPPVTEDEKTVAVLKSQVPKAYILLSELYRNANQLLKSEEARQKGFNLLPKLD